MTTIAEPIRPTNAFAQAGVDLQPKPIVATNADGSSLTRNLTNAPNGLLQLADTDLWEGGNTPPAPANLAGLDGQTLGDTINSLASVQNVVQSVSSLIVMLMIDEIKENGQQTANFMQQQAVLGVEGLKEAVQGEQLAVESAQQEFDSSMLSAGFQIAGSAAGAIAGVYSLKKQGASFAAETELNARISENANEHDTLTDELSTNETELDSLTAKLELNKQSTADLQADVDQKQEEFDACDTASTRLKSKIRTQEQQTAQDKEELDQKTTELEGLDREIGDVQARLDAARQRGRQLQEQIECEPGGDGGEDDIPAAVLPDNQTNANSLHAEQQLNNRSVTDLETELSQKEQAFSEGDAECTRLKSRIETQDQETEQDKAELSENITALDQLDQDIDAAQGRLTLSRQQGNRLETEIESVDDGIGSLKSRLQAVNVTGRDLQNQLTQTQQLLNMFQTKMKIVEQACGTLGSLGNMIAAGLKLNAAQLSASAQLVTAVESYIKTQADFLGSAISNDNANIETTRGLLHEVYDSMNQVAANWRNIHG